MTDSLSNLKPATEAHIAKLRKQFVDSFAERLVKIDEWTELCLVTPPDPGALVSLRTEIHQLRGSSGLYELQDLYREFNALQAELDEHLADSPGSVLPAITRRRLQRVTKMMRFPNRFL